jgi:hypothetical protein
VARRGLRRAAGAVAGWVRVSTAPHVRVEEQPERMLADYILAAVH